MANPIKIKNVYSLTTLPLLYAGVIALCFFLRSPWQPCNDGGFIPLSFLDAAEQNWIWLSAGGAVLFLLSLLLFFIGDRYRLFSDTSVLPAFIFSMLSCGVFCKYGMSGYLLTGFMILLAMARLQHAIHYAYTNTSVFDFGLWTMLAFLISPQLIFLLPWALLILPFCGRTSLKDVLALLLGFFVPLLFVGAYYYFTGRIEEVPDLFTTLFRREALNFPGQLFPDFLPLIILSVLTLLALFRIWVSSKNFKVFHRRGIFSIAVLLLVLVASFFYHPQVCRGIFYVIFVPLSYIFSWYFDCVRRRWMAITVFVLLAVASLFFYL